MATGQGQSTLGRQHAAHRGRRRPVLPGQGPQAHALGPVLAEASALAGGRISSFVHEVGRFKDWAIES